MVACTSRQCTNIVKDVTRRSALGCDFWRKCAWKGHRNIYTGPASVMFLFLCGGLAQPNSCCTIGEQKSESRPPLDPWPVVRREEVRRSPRGLSVLQNRCSGHAVPNLAACILGNGAKQEKVLKGRWREPRRSQNVLARSTPAPSLSSSPSPRIWVVQRAP